MKNDESFDLIKKTQNKWIRNTPCFIVDKKKLINTIVTIQKFLPGEIVYSHKTNPDPSVTKIIKNHKCGFLLSSVEESQKVINNLGINSEKIIFQSPSLTKDQFKKIKSFGISRFIIDSKEQLDIIISNIDGMARKPEILVRINTGIKVSNSELGYSTDSYLGFPVNESIAVFKSLNNLRKKNEIILGLHNHFFSQNTFLSLWEKNLNVMAKHVKRLKKEGIVLDSVDFGGGYPIDYGKKIPTFESITQLIMNATNKMKTIYPDLHFIFEPGRKVVGESITLVTEVVHVKKFLGSNVIILDCSVYNASMDTLIVKLFLPIAAISKGKKQGAFREYVIRGSTPDSLDLFSKKIRLQEINVGDHVLFFHAGAYSFWSDFISLKKPEHLLI